MESTSVINCVGTEVSAWAPGIQWTGIISRVKQYTSSSSRVAFPRKSTMLPGQRSRFAQGERKECNTRTCISKNFVKKRSNHPSGIQLGCVERAWEAVPKASQASTQAKWNVATCNCVRFWGVSRPWEKSVSLADTFDRERDHISAKDLMSY